MSLPAKFSRGAVVLLKNVEFSKAEPPHDKFLVIVSIDVTTDDIYYFFSTSKDRFFFDHPELAQSFVMVSPGSVKCWPKPTLINCLEVRKIKRTKAEERFKIGQLQYREHLPTDIQDSIDEIIKDSETIAEDIKPLILPGYNKANKDEEEGGGHS